jgi:hypothetical protein
MKEFKKPNLSGPRYRPNVHNIANKEFFDKFKKKYPKHSKVDVADLKKIIRKFNELVCETVIETRDGVQLPESIGWLFIGTCQQSFKENIDYGKSAKYGVTVTNKNWETDGKLGKIFFTSYSLKHKMKNREFWGFTACRNFKRTVSKSYAENWNMYIAVDPTKRIQLAQQKIGLKELRTKRFHEQLKTYNEFDL